MLRRPLLIVGATGVCLIGSLLGPSAVRFPLAVMLLALLPGAAMTETLFPRSRDPAEWVLTSLALSIATLILGGLVLNETFGISRESVASFAAGVSIVAAAVGVVWRVRSSPAVLPRWQLGLRVSVREILVLALAAVLVVAAIAYARAPREARGAHGYSLLWIEPTDRSLQLGVESQELQKMQYRLDLRDGSRLIRQWQISLAPGERWGAVLARQPRAHAVEAVLYVPHARSWSVYRKVRAVQ